MTVNVAVAVIVNIALTAVAMVYVATRVKVYAWVENNEILLPLKQ